MKNRNRNKNNINEDDELDIDSIDNWFNNLIAFPDKYLDNYLIEERIKSILFQKRSSRPSYEAGIKKIGKVELQIENLEIFLKLRKTKVPQFERRLISSIGIDQYNIFADMIQQWRDGKSKRMSNEINSLRKIIHEYIRKTYHKVYCKEDTSTYFDCTLTLDSIDKILEVNSIFLEEIFYEFVNNGNTEISSIDDIMLHRGINVPKLNYLNNSVFNEKSFLTSYSLSLNVAEKFSITKREVRAIISGYYSDFKNRVLISSLYSNLLIPKQFELLIIPHWYNLKLNYDGDLDNIQEYTLEANI